AQLYPQVDFKDPTSAAQCRYRELRQRLDELYPALWLDGADQDRRATLLRAEQELAEFPRVDLTDFSPPARHRYLELRLMLPDLYTSMEDNWLDSIVRFTLVLESYAPPQKIPTIRVIRELTSLGLADAKVVSESVPLPMLRFHLREHGDWA